MARSGQGATLSEHTVSETDALLWDRAAAGDQSAFSVLFERHVESLWNHGYRLTGSWSQAQDIASATFLTAWTRRREVTLVRDSALPWLYAVAGNIARSENRRSTRFLRALRRVPLDDTEADHADAVARRVDSDRRTREVADAVRGLPKAEREAVELCLLGEVSTADAALLLGVAEVSVRSRLSRARARLRTKLEGSR
ncbi:RNA polymerase sigma factor [Actinokineospora sp. HUAS TT18]|uniref:RNA polymerase sigma factor n=1 Tax=Actinokineospora sp. HUAS TT18 TaxID=3447451 RepID=UPI003F525354